MDKITLEGRLIPPEQEVKELYYGMDFRQPQYRREVFHRFYEYHLMYRSHPGGVYFMMPYLAKLYSMDIEQRLWVAFINGCSQNIVSTWLILKKFPTFKECSFEQLNEWWNAVNYKFKAGSGWDADRRYFKLGKTGFPQCFASYKACVDVWGNQENMFEAQYSSTEYHTFDNVWDYVRNKFLSFGRLSTFSYLEYLRIQGVPLNCSNLFLEDIEGSKSHRNGLCKVLGRDDLDWYAVEKPDFAGYAPNIIQWLKGEAAQLLGEAIRRTYTNPLVPRHDVNYFTLESTLCCYKGWHRPNRRYPNVYMDMMYNRIKYAEEQWPGISFEIFWDARRQYLPSHLRLEDNPADPGLSKEKQNHYRLTGQPIMMDEEWPAFKNDFNDRIYRI